MGQFQRDISNLKIIVAFHSYGKCINEGLREFLQGKVNRFVYIEHPFSFCKNTSSSLSIFDRGELVEKKLAPEIRGPDILFYIKDMILTLYYVFRLRGKYDLYIGFDNLNAFVGLILKRLGRVKRVVFYTIDYIPKRFNNPLLNRIYHLVDKICCYYVDYLWNLSEPMAEARIKNGVRKERSAPCLVVPQGNNFDKAKRLPIEDINRFDIVFMGHLMKGKGIQFLVDSFPSICEKVKEAKLIIIGSGPIEQPLKEQAKRLGVYDKIKFAGFVEDNSEIDNLMAKCAIAVAPYEPSSDSFAYYADPGKIRFYLAVGLPVVVTKVPKSAFEIEQAKAGIAIDYDQEEFVDAVVKLLKDDKLYLECRENAIRLGSEYSWNKVFTKAFNETLNSIAIE